MYKIGGFYQLFLNLLSNKNHLKNHLQYNNLKKTKN